ncbi:MAG: 4-(cytidine 5'-diphospho)-2-C-methyl-D-erythritol kinase [Rhodobacteraceae bacterium]|nr:4-(cytidine 5'-diphospho)-2-C-methyl-D-erythritol kinase [Paracoccaceae bacterium]
MTARSDRAPAKINLTLHVTGQRADGYHLLDSLVVFTQAGDIVSTQPGSGLVIDGPEAGELSPGADNLVTRAARLMGAGGQGLRLVKTLPVASGIGGGSADAAATLRLLARATGAKLPPLKHLLALGADVPVCLASHPARMQGIGDALSPLPALPRFWLVLVNPRAALSTPDVFRALAQRANPPMPARLPDWPDAGALFDWLAQCRNDLEAPARALAPVIGDVLDTLAAAAGCALARMSGSGATCFGLFAQEAAAQIAAAQIARAHPGWWVQATGLHKGSADGKIAP